METKPWKHFYHREIEGGGIETHLKIADLIPDDRNANKDTKRGNKAVESSLSRFGAGRSILIDKAGRIIAGNKTAANAAAAGITDVEVIQTDGTRIIAVQRTDLDIDSPEGRALAIADNRSSELGLEWNPEVLGTFADLDLKPFFTDEEMAKLVPSSVTNLIGDEDDAPEPPVEPVSKPGDLYIMGDHRLLCGDATNPNDVATLLDGVLPAMVFTDPPYGIKVQMNNPGTVCSGTIMGDETSDVAVAAYHLCTAMNVPLIFWGGESLCCRRQSS